MASAQTWTVSSVLNWACASLEREGDEHPRLSAERILSSALRMSRVELYLNFERMLSSKELDGVRTAVERRAAGEPVQYIVGETAFRHIILRCEPGVFIPRPETEVLVDCVLNCLDCLDGAAASSRGAATHTSSDGALSGDGVLSGDGPFDKQTVLDIGCGTGCISLSVASERPNTHLIATDSSSAAVQLAMRNRDALKLEDRVDIVKCGLADDVVQARQHYFDVLVSNPPYIPTEILNKYVPEEVLGFEPRSALDGGEDGLDVFREILALAPRALKACGVLCVELFEGALEDAKKLVLRQGGWKQVEIVNDLTHRPRVLVAWRKETSHG